MSDGRIDSFSLKRAAMHEESDSQQTIHSPIPDGAVAMNIPSATIGMVPRADFWSGWMHSDPSTRPPFHD
jgi:hypothetical protein